MDGGHDTLGRKLGLALARQQFDVCANGGAGLFEKGRAVGSIARRRRRQHADVADPHVLAQDAETLERGERRADAFLIQPAGGGDAAPERAQHLFIEYWRRRACQPLIGDKPDGIRADVNNRNGLRVRQSAGRQLICVCFRTACKGCGGLIL